jgi:hypothetical protein
MFMCLIATLPWSTLKVKKAVEMEQPEQALHLGLSSARVLVGSGWWI